MSRLLIGARNESLGKAPSDAAVTESPLVLRIGSPAPR